MINNYKYSSPFKILISFHKVIEGLEQIALSNVEYRVNYAQALLKEIQEKPEFRAGFDNLESIESNNELIKYLLADLFPSGLTQNEIKAATIPFYDITFNYSERFKKILEEADFKFDVGIRGMDEHQFYIMNCTLILNAYYNQNIDFGKPLFYDIPDKNGIIKHYRALYNADFLEIYPKEKTKLLNQSEINELIDNYDNLALWKKAFPEDSWILKGFAIVSLIDVTVESAVSILKSNLLNTRNKSAELNESFQSIFRSVFKIPDLKVGFTFYDSDEDLFINPTFSNNNIESYILLNEKEAGCKNTLCESSYENLIENKKHFIITNVTDFGESNVNERLASHLLSQGIQSFLLAPVVRDTKLLGLIELASPTSRALNSVNATKLELILPYISDTIEKSNTDMTNQLEALIQKEYTAIHPSVYWKFKKEAKKYLNLGTTDRDYSFKEIVFKDVYPLYGQIDIKESSENRNSAIVDDLREQINHIIAIFDLIDQAKKISVLSKKRFELQGFLVALQEPFQNNLEQIIHHYIEAEIHSFLTKDYDTKGNEAINDYFQKLDARTGMFYQSRKDFDDTITTINKKMAAILDAKEQQAQEIFPHYYERFKTDGVEHNLYIGASIDPTRAFNTMYLQNIRLWQLETLCEMELEHHNLKSTLPCDLDVTSLILVFSAPISIRFRMDEKRFDVDGSYNARYEVVKKRIDKAFEKNTKSRITQKEKITIVYSNTAEEKEYIKYIKYLQHKNVLEDEIEKLEVEDLQAVSGLKALRVKVKHNKNSLVVAAEVYITKLFDKRLDSKFTYHNFEHTKNVVLGIETLCKAEKIDEETTKILILAGWFHDAGYIECSDNHEKESVVLALEFLRVQNASVDIQEKVANLIMATAFTYAPKNKLEEIIKDADNAHLADRNYPNIVQQLRKEWEVVLNKKYCNTDWFTLTIAFLKNQHYYTKFAKDNWQSLKEQNLKTIELELQNQ